MSMASTKFASAFFLGSVLLNLYSEVVVSSQAPYIWPDSIGKDLFGDRAPPNECDPPSGYELRIDTPTRYSYYKWFNYETSYAPARNTCVSDKANRITMRTKEEHDVFVNIYKGHNEYMWTGLVNYGLVSCSSTTYCNDKLWWQGHDGWSRFQEGEEDWFNIGMNMNNEISHLATKGTICILASAHDFLADAHGGCEESEYYFACQYDCPGPMA